MNTPITCDVGNPNSVPRCTLYDAESTRLAGVADPAVAGRIVACINACASISDPAAAIPAAFHCLSQIIQSLPRNRDWLDPDIERAACELLKQIKP